MSKVLPSGSGLVPLLAIAAVAAVLANIINNLPATLVLLPLVAPSWDGGHPGGATRSQYRSKPDLCGFTVKSVVAPRATPRRDVEASVGEYTRLGICTVPAALVVAVLALWLSVRGCSAPRPQE